MSKGLQGIAYGPTTLKGVQPAPLKGGFYHQTLLSGMPDSAALAAAAPLKRGSEPARWGSRVFIMWVCVLFRQVGSGSVIKRPMHCYTDDLSPTTLPGSGARNARNPRSG